MFCEDQMILLEIYKVEVRGYSLAVHALSESTTMSTSEFLRRLRTARVALENSFAILHSLNDHIESHGCRPEPEAAEYLIEFYKD